jgi:hypothetical protein
LTSNRRGEGAGQATDPLDDAIFRHRGVAEENARLGGRRPQVARPRRVEQDIDGGGAGE